MARIGTLVRIAEAMFGRDRMQGKVEEVGKTN